MFPSVNCQTMEYDTTIDWCMVYKYGVNIQKDANIIVELISVVINVIVNQYLVYNLMFYYHIYTNNSILLNYLTKYTYYK